jgi:4-alpha-glucanotransferase
MVDIVRIDHFRGFAGYWEIAASEPTAMNGRWLPGPGEALFEAIEQALGPLPIIAEDLGIITPDVTALRKRFAVPGMAILQFAFSADRKADAVYLPHNHERDSVVYTGTHDNDTTVGWWQQTSEPLRQHVRDYLATDGHDIAWTLIRAASASVADTAIHPMQDVLGLDSRHRMNFPGQADGHWGWRFGWGDVKGDVAGRLKGLGELHGRCA